MCYFQIYWPVRGTLFSVQKGINCVWGGGGTAANHLRGDDRRDDDDDDDDCLVKIRGENASRNCQS